MLVLSLHLCPNVLSVYICQFNSMFANEVRVVKDSSCQQVLQQVCALHGLSNIQVIHSLHLSYPQYD
jgi:hypothetical protein